MKIAVVKYTAGNVGSVMFALERTGVSALLTDNASEIQSADKVIFPGVGEAGSTMKYLKSKGLDKIIISLKQPVLGICLGMQLMCKYSEEGNTECLGIFNQYAKKFSGIEKVPQLGWNNIYQLQSALFRDIPENTFMYFVHSYYVESCTDTIAATEYINEYSSAIRKNNFYAVQFHPEKSGDSGQKILENFLKL